MITVRVEEVFYCPGGKRSVNYLFHYEGPDWQIASRRQYDYIITAARIIGSGRSDASCAVSFDALLELRSALGLKRLLRDKYEVLVATYPPVVTITPNERGVMVITTESAHEWVRCAGFSPKEAEGK